MTIRDNLENSEIFDKEIQGEIDKAELKELEESKRKAFTSGRRRPKMFRNATKRPYSFIAEERKKPKSRCRSI